MDAIKPYNEARYVDDLNNVAFVIFDAFHQLRLRIEDGDKALTEDLKPFREVLLAHRQLWQKQRHNLQAIVGLAVVFGEDYCGPGEASWAAYADFARLLQSFG